MKTRVACRVVDKIVIDFFTVKIKLRYNKEKENSR